MLELHTRNLPVSEYPIFWRLNAMKVGPPDYAPYKWSPNGAARKKSNCITRHFTGSPKNPAPGEL